MNLKTFSQIDDRNCTIYQSEQAECLLFQPVDEHDLEVLDNEVTMIHSLTDKFFTLVAFEIKDWQSELTPWPAPPVFGKIPFGNGAATTLSFVLEKLIPQLAQKGYYIKDTMRCLLGGYSLAGFFALWAGYQTKVFDGIAAASPSVWYPQWIDYADNHKPIVADIYLSLGDKEEKTKNPSETVFAGNRNCWCHKESIQCLSGILVIISNTQMKELPKDLRGSSIKYIKMLLV